MMKTIFLMIARVLYDKGYQEYVEAAKIIKKDYADVEFQLLGSIDEAYPNHVPESVVLNDCKDGIINYLGYKTNVRPFIQAADCIIHPTFYNEGMSRVLMEAMAMKKAIITTDIPGCRETVDQNKNGYLVPPKNVPALVEAIQNFINLPEIDKHLMGEYARIKVEKEFDVKNVIAVYKKITEQYLTK